MARMAYLFSTFPALTTTFVRREVNAVLDSGFDIILAANRAPEPGGFHPQEEKLLNKTFYITPFRPCLYLLANLRRFTESPTRYLGAVKLALTLRDTFPFQRVTNLMHLAGAAVLAEHLVRNQVVHAHVHFAFGAASVAMFLQALTGISYSLSIHGSDVLLPRPLTEEKLKRAKFVVSNCRFHIHNLGHRYLSLAKQQFYLVRIGLDLGNAPWLPAKHPAIDLALRILNVGRLLPVKGQDVLIRACAALRDKGVRFQCRIVGEGPRRRELEDLVADLDLNDYVELMGARYEPEVVEFYEWSHVVVLSSLSEGTPMTIIEAMAKAKPVIAPRITALPEMVLDGHTGYLFESGSVDDLTEKLAKFAFQPERIGPMGREARLRAEMLFDLSTNVQQLLANISKEIPSLDKKKHHRI